MAPIATLTVRVSAQIAELQKSFTDASKSTKEFQDGFETTATRAAAAGAVIGNVFTSLASKVASAFGASLTSVVALGGALTDLSAKTGISVRALQEFQFAGERVGVSLDDVSTAVLQMQKQLEGGGKPVAAALQTIGLSLKDLQGLKPEEQFRKIAASLAQIEDPALRNKTAFDIMGKAAASVLPLIGSDIDAAAAKAHALGVVLDDETVAALDDLGDTFGDLKLASEALFAKGLAPLLPLVTTLAKTVVDMPAPLQAVAAGVAALAAVAAPLGLALSAVTSGFSAVVGGVSSVVGALSSVTSSFIDGTKAIYDYVTQSKNVNLAKLGEGGAATSTNVYAVAGAVGALLVALHELQDYLAMQAQGRHVSWWETLIPPVGEWESMKASWKQGVEGLQPYMASFNAWTTQQYSGLSIVKDAGAAIGGTAGPTKAAAAAMSELARLNKQYQDDLSSKGLQAFKDAAELHDKYSTSLADAAKEQGIAESSLQRYIDDQRAAEAGVRKHTEELTRLTEADKKWRDQVTGRAADKALADLTRRWDSLTAAEKKNPQVVAAAVAEYDKLRDTLPAVGGELESLRNTTQKTIPTTQDLQQHMLLFGTATLDASQMLAQGAAALQGYQRNGNLVSASLVDMAVQMKAVPWDLPGKNLDDLHRAVTPIRDAFSALGDELPKLLAEGFRRNDNIWGTLAVAVADRFTTTFQKALDRAAAGGTKVTGTEKALGAIGAGVDIFTGGYAMGASGGKVKGALGGAASGALSGASMGTMIGGPGIGTAVGAVAGGIVGLFGGLFGGGKKAKEDRAALAANKKALLEQYGGMQQLVKLADQLHVNIQKAFDAKNANQFTDAVNELNKAIDEEKKKMEALGGAVDALNTRTGIFGAKFQAILDAKPPEGASADDTTKFQAQQANKLSALAQTSGDEFDRLGLIARDTFAGLVKDNGNAIQAMEQMAPTFQVLTDGVDKFGLTASGVTQDLIDNFKLVNDTAFKPLFDQIVADGQILQDLMDAKSLSPEGFQALATDIGAGIQGVIDKGGDMARTLALSQPVLQSLWEAQQQYGAITDDTTSKILQQAHDQGLVGDQMKSVNEQILDVLLSIGKVLGADLPDYFSALQTPAKNAADDVEQAFSNIDIPPIDIKYQYVAMNDAPPGVNIPALGRGGIVRRPTLALVGESGPEAVIPLSSGGLGVTPQNYQTDIYLDGDRIARSTAKRMPAVLKGVGAGV